MGLIVRYLRPVGPFVRDGLVHRASGIILAKMIDLRSITMQDRQRKLTPPQDKALKGKLRKLIDWDDNNSKLAGCKTLQELFHQANVQANELFLPQAVVFVRNELYRSSPMASFGVKFDPKALSLTKSTSSVIVAQHRNLTVYVPRTDNPRIILSDAKHRMFDSTFKELGIKMNEMLMRTFRSFAVVPAYYEPKDETALGSVFMGWSKSEPIDPDVDLEAARVLVDYYSIALNVIGSLDALGKVEKL